jgi:hypothetical protein
MTQVAIMIGTRTVKITGREAKKWVVIDVPTDAMPCVAVSDIVEDTK